MTSLLDCFLTIDRYLNDLNKDGKLLNFEGHIAQAPYCHKFVEETLHLIKGPLNILQIGFNAGHSTLIMLFARPHCLITSVDLGKTYIDWCSNYINTVAPDRHTLIIGNSLDVLPTLEKDYNMFFIDGGHDYETAKKDLENCYNLVEKSAIIIIDDIVELMDCSKEHTYTLGPTRAYKEFLASGKGQHYSHIEVRNRGMSVCFVHKN